MDEELFIINIKDKLKEIQDSEAKGIFYQIFEEPCLVYASLKVPEKFREKVYSWFVKKDSSGILPETVEQVVKKAESQKIIKTFNKITYEGAVFNELRALKPLIYNKEMHEKNNNPEEQCDFCEPESFTALDGFGRIYHNNFITGSNIAKAELLHSNIIFPSHSFKLNFENLLSVFETAEKWFVQVNKENPRAIYPFLSWNLGYKAGASFLHPHIQIAMGSDSPPAKFRKLKKEADNYFDKYHADYFEDLFQAHNLVGLALQKRDFKILFYLTPIKEKEVLIISDNLIGLIEPLYKVLKTYTEELGVSNFNLALYQRPIKEIEAWKNFPYILRIVDRGSSESKSADIAGYELYGNNVISTDPYMVKRAVEKNL